METRPNLHYIIAELTNGQCGYVPTRQAMALGGYETMCRNIDEEAGRIIVETSAQLINSLIDEIQ